MWLGIVVSARLTSRALGVSKDGNPMGGMTRSSGKRGGFTYRDGTADRKQVKEYAAIVYIGV